MSRKIDKKEPVYVRVKMVNGFPHYVLCQHLLGSTCFFNSELNVWVDNLAKSDTYLDVKKLISASLKAGFKQVIEVSAFRLTDDSIQYLVKSYTEERGVEFPAYLFVNFENKQYKWCDLRFWYKTEEEAITAVNEYPNYRKMPLTQSIVEGKVSPAKTKKVKKKRPPSVMRAFKKEVIQTIKQRRLTCISLAEESSIHECIRNDHVRDAKKYEAQLKKLGARFPKWKYSWER